MGSDPRGRESERCWLNDDSVAADVGAGLHIPYKPGVDLTPILATAAGIVAYRGVVSPAAAKYRAWRDGPRVQVARRNWRGVYVPDLGVKRGERLFWLAYAGFIVMAGAIGWTVLLTA